MKKIIIIIISVFLFMTLGTQLFAQTKYRSSLQKGSSLVGGSMGINFGNGKYRYSYQQSSQSNTSKISSFYFNPKIGGFVSNGLALGISLDLDTNTEESEQSTYKIKSTVTNYLLGPFLRVYTNSGIFFGGNYTFGKTTIKNSYTGGSNSYDTNTSKWELGVGYAAFLNDHVALEPSISYQGFSSKEEEDGTSYTHHTGQLVIGLGLSIYLRKK
jgi:outer membrane protein